VHPGHLDTDMIAGAREVAPAMIAAMEANVPMKLLGMPSDVAAMNLFLASDESRYVTGCRICCRRRADREMRTTLELYLATGEIGLERNSIRFSSH